MGPASCSSRTGRRSGKWRIAGSGPSPSVPTGASARALAAKAEAEIQAAPRIRAAEARAHKALLRVLREEAQAAQARECKEAKEPPRREAGPAFQAKPEPAARAGDPSPDLAVPGAPAEFHDAEDPIAADRVQRPPVPGHQPVPGPVAEAAGRARHHRPRRPPPGPPGRPVLRQHQDRAQAGQLDAAQHPPGQPVRGPGSWISTTRATRPGSSGSRRNWRRPTAPPDCPAGPARGSPSSAACA